MLVTRIVFLCLLCITLTQSAEEQKDIKSGRLATGTSAAEAESTIYKIKKLNSKDKHGQQKLKHDQEYKQTQHKQFQTQISNDPAMPDKPPRTKKLKNTTKNAHSLNKKLLNKLGFIKVKAPNSHNRKRLAVESRRHASRDDSHMFIIKLPPNLYYYTSPNEATTTQGVKGVELNTKNPMQQNKPPTAKSAEIAMKTTKTAMEKTNALEALNANGKKVSFSFPSNGRPGRIYHWNLPVLKKALEDKQRFAHVPSTTKDRLLDIKDIPTWSKPWENDTIEKSFTIGNKSNYKKSLKPKSPTYYAPMNAVNKNSFNKYFAGNGKPKGFYVIKENQKKPLYYKNIIS